MSATKMTFNFRNEVAGAFCLALASHLIASIVTGRASRQYIIAFVVALVALSILWSVILNILKSKAAGNDFRRDSDSYEAEVRKLPIEEARVRAEKILKNPQKWQGFVVTKASSDFADIFPLGQMRRTQPDGTVDLAEIQFMTHRRAAFRINGCAVPKEGIMTLGGPRTADGIDAGGLHDHFEMYASPRWRLWFSLRFWRLRAPSEAGYESLARSVALMLPEVELALRQGKLGHTCARSPTRISLQASENVEPE